MIGTPQYIIWILIGGSSITLQKYLLKRKKGNPY